MDEFAVDLDKVLDEFEQSEDGALGGNVAETDGIQHEEIHNEVERAELDQPHLAANFPAFEALDLDLAEADFAPSNFGFSSSPREDGGGQNFHGTVSDVVADAGNLPVRRVELVQNYNENGHRVPEVVDFQPAAQVPPEVDVISACRHAIVGPAELYEPPVMQEQDEREAASEIVPAAPPDIVCSAPDLVSSAIVGIDIVPISCTDATFTGGVNLALDLTLAPTEPNAVHLNDAENADAGPGADVIPESSRAPAEYQEHCDFPCDADVFKNSDVTLAEGKELRETDEIPSVHATSPIADLVPNSHSHSGDSSGDNNTISCDKAASFHSVEDKTEQNGANDSSSSLGSSYPSDILRGIPEATVSSYDETALKSDAEPQGMADPMAAVVTCSSDINEKTENHGPDVAVSNQEPLPDISQISISGFDSRNNHNSISDVTYNARHCDRQDQHGNKDVDHEMDVTSPDCLLHSIVGNDCSHETESIRNKMPPAYWDCAEGDDMQISGSGRSHEKFKDLSNDFSQIGATSDDIGVIDKTNNERVEGGDCVAFPRKSDAESTETGNALVENYLQQEGFKQCLNDPEIIKDGKFADTNLAESRSELAGGTRTLQDILSNGAFEVHAEAAGSECQNCREEVKYGLDLVSDVVILESFPEFGNSGDVICPDVAVSGISANEVKSGAENDSTTVTNGLESRPVSEARVPEAFGILKDETFTNLMSEVAEEMERMINQENSDAEAIGNVGMGADDDDFNKTCKNSFEDQAIFVQSSGLENHHRGWESSILEAEPRPSVDASLDVVKNVSTEQEIDRAHLKEDSDNKKADTSLPNQVAGASPEQYEGSFPGEDASSVKVPWEHAIGESDQSPMCTSPERHPSEFSTGARQKQVKTVKHADVVSDATELSTEDAAMSTGAQPGTAATGAALGGPHVRPTSILQTFTSPSDIANSPSDVTTPTIPLCSNISLEVTQLGKVAPIWLPDAEASKCMECEVAFSFTRRRHHCRACGKVFCNGCSNLKVTIPYLENKQERVCSKCYQDLVRASYYERTMPNAGTRQNLSDSDSSPAQARSPPESQHHSSPANPSTGVLRKQGSMKLSGEAKQVMFSDGVRPGGALTELDGSSEVRTTSSRRSRKSDKTSSRTASTLQTRNSADVRRTSCLIPSSGLPPIIIPAANGEFSLKDSAPQDTVFQQIKNAQSSNPLMFAINRDVAVMVKIVNLDCCVNRLCWCFTTKGLCTVGQDEIVILLECLPDEKTVPVDILRHLHVIYEMASHGNTVTYLDHTVLPAGSLGCQESGGFLYIRQTFQCLQKLSVPDPPYLFGLLIQRWEMSWAKVFPLRLVFRLGAEFRYYPCPLISVRSRKSVYGEIGHTIMNLLADFHNYQYMVPRINGLVIHMEDKRTTVSIPRNRHKMLMKVLSNSDDHVIALGASFSSTADSHLVCLQSDDGNYQTQAINIQNRPRRVTGACFIVFNGALKPTSGLRAKSSIVEDGLMVQVTSDAMTELKQVLTEMKDYKILCGSIEIAQPDEMVIIEWNDEEKSINQGVKSPIDGLSMFGVDSIRIHGSTDYAKDMLSIRWTEVFVLRNGAASNTASSETPADVSHLAEALAQACCQALVNHLSQLAFEMLTKIGLRVTIDSEQVGYEVGSCGVRLPGFCMNDLDEKLISVIHGSASSAQSGPIVLELIFHVIHPYGTNSGAGSAASGTN